MLKQRRRFRVFEMTPSTKLGFFLQCGRGLAFIFAGDVENIRYVVDFPYYLLRIYHIGLSAAFGHQSNAACKLARFLHMKKKGT